MLQPGRAGRTDPDSNVEIEEIDGDTYVDEGEDDEPAPVRAKAKARVKAPAKKKAPVQKKAARRARSAA